MMGWSTATATTHDTRIYVITETATVSITMNIASDYYSPSVWLPAAETQESGHDLRQRQLRAWSLMAIGERVRLARSGLDQTSRIGPVLAQRELRRGRTCDGASRYRVMLH